MPSAAPVMVAYKSLKLLEKTKTGKSIDLRVCESKPFFSPQLANQLLLPTLLEQFTPYWGADIEFFNHWAWIDWQPLSSTTTEMEWALIQTQWGGTSLLNAALCLFSHMPFTSAHRLKSPLTFYSLQKEVKQVLQQLWIASWHFLRFPQNAPFGGFVHKILRKVNLFTWKFCKVLLWCKLMETVGNALWVDGAIIVSLPFEQSHLYITCSWAT